MSVELKPFHLNILHSMKQLLTVYSVDETGHHQFEVLGEVLAHSNMPVGLLEEVIDELKALQPVADHSYIGYKDYLRTLLISLEERLGAIRRVKEYVPQQILERLDDFTITFSNGLFFQHYSSGGKVLLSLVTVDGRVLSADKRNNYCSIGLSFPSDTQVITSLSGLFMNYDRASGRFHEVFAGKEIYHTGRRITLRIPVGSVVVFKIRHTS